MKGNSLLNNFTISTFNYDASLHNASFSTCCIFLYMLHPSLHAASFSTWWIWILLTRSFLALTSPSKSIEICNTQCLKTRDKFSFGISHLFVECVWYLYHQYCIKCISGISSQRFKLEYEFMFYARLIQCQTCSFPFGLG